MKEHEKRPTVTVDRELVKLLYDLYEAHTPYHSRGCDCDYCKAFYAICDLPLAVHNQIAGLYPDAEP